MQPIFNKLPKPVSYLFWIIVFVYVLTVILPYSISGIFIEKMVFVPLRFFNMENISDDWIASIISPIGYSFLHSNFTHIFMNLALFLPFGLVVAKTIGDKGFIALYTLGAIGGAYCAYVLNPTSPIPMVGASASVSALVGFIVSSSVLGQRFIAPFDTSRNSLIFFAVWGVFNIIFPYFFANNISWEAHLGGFAVGFVLSPIFLRLQSSKTSI